MDINVIISLGSLAVAVVVMVWSIRSGTRSDAAQNARLDTKLDMISRGVDDIRLDTKAQGERISKLGEKIAVMEQSITSAHKRIDDMKERIAK